MLRGLKRIRKGHKMELSKEEKNIIIAYRQAPETFKNAIRKLLDVKEPTKIYKFKTRNPEESKRTK